MARQDDFPGGACGHEYRERDYSPRGLKRDQFVQCLLAHIAVPDFPAGFFHQRLYLRRDLSGAYSVKQEGGGIHIFRDENAGERITQKADGWVFAGWLGHRQLRVGVGEGALE